MPRPQIIRADTIDLQHDQDHPSAKNHSPSNGVATKAGPGIAPSQANALMNVAQEQAHEQHDLMTVQHRINGASNGDSYIPDSISPYDHDPHYGHGHDDDTNDEDELDEDMLDRMSSSPSISDEDIDFEFVYALHTFIATVEGQANATKGDTMVLLDDSNSYWWLVRVVKDSSIGYLPAEHIETPSERLARLNKHRNVDLSTPMLGDNQEKSKNILKKAMRRRAAKTVQFAPPTYVEASDYDYSTDEEDIEGGYYSNDDEGAAMEEDTAQAENAPASASIVVDDEITPIDAPDTAEKPRALEENIKEKPQERPKEKPKEKENEKEKEKEKDREEEKTIIKPFARAERRDSEDIFEHSKVDAPTESKPRGRATDSVLFGDPNSEPRRITLTPKLARDDDIQTSPSVVPVKPKTSLDRIGKRDDVLSPPPATKPEKAKKEKKSVFGNLFKKRKTNSKDDEIDEFLHANEKKSSDSLRDDSSSGRPGSSRGGNSFEQQSPQLQYQPARSQQQQQNEKLLQNPPTQQQQQQTKGPEPSNIGKLTRPPIRTIDSVREVDEEEEERPFGMKFAKPIPPIDKQQSIVIPIKESPKPEQGHMAPAALQQQPTVEASPVSVQTSISESGPIYEEPADVVKYTDDMDGRADGYYSDTPDDLTPHELPSLIPDNGSGSEDNNPHDTPTDSAYPGTPVAQPGSPAELVWSEAALKTYLDDDNQDIRDFLVVVNHRTEVSSVKSHPQITPLFADANSKLQDITTRLDSILDRYMKSRR
ncbi:hypothetical protein H072_8935 [Dactylellina haptotyla CBS 200.50]|uniref:SH3 domain-containing protein n=1 Tax=Dactylellina haptotyla (strain CBS 200.50) TaxID=1284197 RepID=S8A3R3_DACHA|nr:hypothetical protein H072_8935 [Dactylellina haptotyla CBS 200.50]